MKKYAVFVKTDDLGHITAVNSSAFLGDPAGWTQIDEGSGDRYHHAQGNYFPQPIITGSGVYRYKLTDGTALECTAEEIAEQEAANQTGGAVETDVYDDLAAAIREGVNSV